MTAAPSEKSKGTQIPPEKSTVILLFLIAADTTWRMFVPIIGGVALGVWADRSFSAKPLWTSVGIAIGVTIAILLVRQQLKEKQNVQ